MHQYNLSINLPFSVKKATKYSSEASVAVCYFLLFCGYIAKTSEVSFTLMVTYFVPPDQSVLTWDPWYVSIGSVEGFKNTEWITEIIYWKHRL